MFRKETNKVIIYGNTEDTEHHKTERKENIPVEAQLSTINDLNTLIMPIKKTKKNCLWLNKLRSIIQISIIYTKVHLSFIIRYYLIMNV